VETNFFLTGSLNDDRLLARLRDKIKITIDIPTSAEAKFTRARDGLGPAEPGSYLSGTTVSGFSYYNFSTKRWDMIGLTDPETGRALPFDWRVQPAEGTDMQNITSGTNHFPSQFVAYHGGHPTWSGSFPTGTVTGNQQQEIIRRMKIGSPTVSHFAPFANKYHATASQTLKMRNYINQPFLLEKVVVQLPVQAERRSNSSTFFSSSNYTIGQEDYVFFIYRQEKNFFAGTGSQVNVVGLFLAPSRDQLRTKAEYATGSMRYLICSGVMTFYNNYVLWSTGSAGVDGLNGYVPLNTPAFSHNWNVASNSNPASANAAVYTGSVTLNMPVAVASPYMSTDHQYYSSTGSLKRGKIQHYWPGGTAALPFGPSNISGKQDPGFYTLVSASMENCWVTQGGLVGEPPFGKPTYTYYADTAATAPNFSATKKRMRIEKVDPRAVKMFGGDMLGSGSEMVSEQSAISPYLLLPEDELVFGFEAALPPLGLYDDGSTGVELGTENNLTGSMLRIMPGTAKVTFYGSTIRAGEPYDVGHPQYLTTENISEIIAENISDQFKILRGNDRLVLTLTRSSRDQFSMLALAIKYL
jgi:hypothetical protein